MVLITKLSSKKYKIDLHLKKNFFSRNPFKYGVNMSICVSGVLPCNIYGVILGFSKNGIGHYKKGGYWSESARKCYEEITQCVTDQ